MGVGKAMRNPLAVAIASILLAVLAPRFLKKKKKETIATIKPDGPISVESTSSASGNDYEVFLSFRGRDTRTGLTDYLYSSLVDAGVSVFRDDDELRIGEKIDPDLLRAIKSSKISIPILSPDNASSKWCLRELARMIECKRSEGHVVLPILYKVEPGHVRHQTGSFGKAFHSIKKHHEAEVVQQWERALQEVGSLKGWESERIANLGGCQMLRKLPDLSNLKHLSVLSLKFCSELREVKGLEGLVSLTMLDGLKCPKFSRLDGVECLMSLRYLSIGPSEALERLMDRLELSNLKVLPSCENQVEIQVLNSFICLEVLDLTDCKSMERLDLSSLKLLRKANARKYKNLIEIRGLDGLEYLERLDISECTSIKRLDIAKLKYLRYLWASKCKNLCEVRGLDVLEYLEWLDISGCISIKTLPDLSCFKTLKFLNINHCEKLRDIQTLEKFSSCQWLYIDGCKSLEKLPNLSKFEGLIELIVKDCHELLDISELKELRSLEFIDMSRCKSVEHLPDLSLCKNLKCLVVRNCEKLIELTGLGDLASLWQVDISGCKSLTIPELPGTHIIQNYEEPMHHPLYGTHFQLMGCI